MLNKLLFNNRYALLALDHRGSLFKMLKEKGVKDIESSAFEFKKEVISNLCGLFSGVLVDYKIGLEAYKKVGCKKPFLLCVEKSGYVESEGERFTEIEYSPLQLKKSGAIAAKLLLYFNPNYKSAKHQLKIGKKVFEECKKLNFPLFLEIVVYKKDGGRVEDKLILQSIETFLKAGVYPQVFKLQPPENFEVAKAITHLLKKHNLEWIVLTQGVNFLVFKERLKIAFSAGCKGFLAGRSIWKEGVGLKKEDLEEFLKTTAFNRFKEIVNL